MCICDVSDRLVGVCKDLDTLSSRVLSLDLSQYSEAPAATHDSVSTSALNTPTSVSGSKRLSGISGAVSTSGGGDVSSESVTPLQLQGGKLSSPTGDDSSSDKKRAAAKQVSQARQRPRRTSVRPPTSIAEEDENHSEDH